MATGDADESMTITGGESMVTGDADGSVTTGEGASKSLDPYPIVPMVGANSRCSTPAMPILEGF
jgi:hypothetical protein